MNIMVFAANVRHLREALSLTQPRIGEILGFSKATWSNYENEVSFPKLNELEKLSKYFGVLESDLFHTYIKYTDFEEVKSRYLGINKGDNPPAYALYNFINRTENTEKKTPKNDEKYPKNDEKHTKTDEKHHKNTLKNEQNVRPTVPPPVHPTPNLTHFNTQNTPPRRGELHSPYPHAVIARSEHSEQRSNLNTTQSNTLPKVITVDNSGRENITFVPVKAQAGYLIGYGDQEYIASLTTFSFPGIHHGTYRMFEVAGTSMLPALSPNDKVIAANTAQLNHITEGDIYVVVSTQGIAVKRVSNRIYSHGYLLLSSDNTEYPQEFPPIHLPPEDILELWHVEHIVTSPQPFRTPIGKHLKVMEATIARILSHLNLPPETPPTQAPAEPTLPPTH
ncbi:LexA family transcriptional regulator [bacterium]|nr:LexA family transcriptional regulator [bacterium]